MEIRLFNGRVFKSDNFENIINCVKNESPFTENLNIDEYIDGFKDRYLELYPYKFWGDNDFEAIVKLMISLKIIEFI